MKAKQVYTLASYNRWMNDQLYKACIGMTDAERKQDRSAFFHSIHGTLNHILVADGIWMARFTKAPVPDWRLDQELHADFNELRNAREQQDQRIIEWAAGLADDDLAGELEYITRIDPQPRRSPMWLAVAHFFNHQTHHRGQVTAMLSQCGIDYGITDLVWMPEVIGLDNSGSDQ